MNDGCVGRKMCSSLCAIASAPDADRSPQAYGSTSMLAVISRSFLSDAHVPHHPGGDRGGRGGGSGVLAAPIHRIACFDFVDLPPPKGLLGGLLQAPQEPQVALTVTSVISQARSQRAAYDGSHARSQKAAYDGRCERRQGSPHNIIMTTGHDDVSHPDNN